MSRIVKLCIQDILPDTREVLAAQGVPEQAPIQESVMTVVLEALDIVREKAVPVGILEELSQSAFARIFDAQGLNEEQNPLQTIYPRAERLALFALTLGEATSGKIQSLFEEDDFAAASLLDTAASLAADRAVEILESDYCTSLSSEGVLGTDGCVLSYSPGYCGWHISAQAKLFEYLRPMRIGISLNSSYLMTPLKSVSGVLVAGKREIHYFDNSFSFCQECPTISCQQRMARIRGSHSRARQRD